MNKARRQELYDVINLLEEASGRLEEIQNDEQDAFDNLPESLQYSTRGDSMQEAIDTMETWNNEIASTIQKITDYAKK